MSNFTIEDIGADIIDVRDIIERIEELEEIEDIENTIIEQPDSDEASELIQLRALMDELRGNGGDEQWRGDWYPITLIHESYFEAAMDDLIDDIGELPKDLPSYLKVSVDYDALRMDYSEVTICGDQHYLYR